MCPTGHYAKVGDPFGVSWCHVAANWMSCGHEVDIEVGHVDQELLVGVVMVSYGPCSWCHNLDNDRLKMIKGVGDTRTDQM